MSYIDYNQEYPKENRQYKSSIFCKIFSDKKDLLELYNALNDTDYQDPEDFEINTLENIVYISIKNDVSFLFDFRLNLYEHQSTYNPNMPLRGLMYLSQLYNKYVNVNDLNLFSSSLKRIPTPQYIVFYNGRQEEPERKILRLSDAFANVSSKGCLECEATMININYGHNQELMQKCQKLKEYAIFIETTRNFTAQYPDNIRKAITKAVEYCIANNILKDLLVSQKAEVLETMVWTFNKELYEKELREDAISEGHAEGHAKGLAEGRAEGLAEGRAEGLAEGRLEGRLEGEKILLLKQIQKKLSKNMSIDQISEALEESPELIQQYIQELQNK